MTMNNEKTPTISAAAGMTTTTPTTITNNNNTIPELLEWNLIDRISPYLDRHMIFPLLDYFEKQIQDVAATATTTTTTTTTKNVGSTNSDDSTTTGTTIPVATKETLFRDVNEARYALLRPTHMIDYMVDVYNSIHTTPGTTTTTASATTTGTTSIPEEMIQQKQQVLQDLESLKEQCLPLLEGIDATTRESLQTSGQWNIPYLSETYPITMDVIDAYRNYGKYQFDCGDYECARTILSNYIQLFANPPITAQQQQQQQPTANNTSTNNSNDDNTKNNNEDEELAGMTAQQQQRKDAATPAIVGNPAMFYLLSCDSAMLHVLWGRLACEILVSDWTNAMKALEAVKTAFESMVSTNQLTALQALQQRTWLLHWSLFVHWNAPAGLEQLVELFLSERYKQAITTVAPHLLRYLTAAVLLCKRRGEKAVPTAEARKLVKMLIYVMQDCDYTDPIVEFVNCLCIKFDFDSAQEKLAACEKVLSADFFLCHQTALFMEEARVFVFENYCRIHNKIDLVALGDKLAMDQERAERWIVDLIRNADLDAKIDSSAGCVVMGLSQPPTIHEQIVDRTRDCNIRTATMSQNLSNLFAEARKEKAKRELLAREQD